MTQADTIKRWTDQAAALLVGRRIVSVRYLTDKEKEALMWHSAALVLELDAKGKQPTLSIWPSSDDEGNAAGAFFTTDDSLETIPVI
jgi:hypothetical protein